MKFQAIEPFPILAERQILSKEHAQKVIKENSYYFFTLILFLIPFGFYLLGTAKGNRETAHLGFGLIFTHIIYLVLVLFIRHLSSRIASSVLFSLYCFSYIHVLWMEGPNAFHFIKIFLCAAGFRLVQASFAFHKYE